MQQIATISTLVGKTIVGVVESYDNAELLLVFADHTMAWLRSNVEENEIQLEGFHHDLLVFPREALIAATAATAEELDQLAVRRDRQTEHGS